MIYNLATRFKAPLALASASTLALALALIALSKPPSSISNKPSGPYVSRLYAPALKQINNKAYMVVVARDRVYQDSYSQNRYL
jgi:hypothetical protein